MEEGEKQIGDGGRAALLRRACIQLNLVALKGLWSAM